jgi:ribose-phosphate pyrophosphokinase
VLSNGSAKRIKDSVLEEVVVTDSISPSKDTLGCKKIRVIPIARLMGEAIRRIANEESVSKLFD